MNSEEAKRIELFLPNGNAQGICEVRTVVNPVRAVSTPRAELSMAKEEVNITSPGVYFLFEESSDRSGKKRVYIGEGTNCYKRVKQHKYDDEKGFWDTSILFMSNTGGELTIAQHKYIEYKTIIEARKIGRFKVENGKTPNKPSISDGRMVEAERIMESIKSILSILGFKVLVPIERESEGIEVKIKYGGVDARGEYKNGEVIVIEGSELDKETTDGFEERYGLQRKELVEDGTIVEKDEKLVFNKDHPFDSPSQAANIIAGTRLNGWEYWVDEDGKSLNELED